MSIWRYNNHCYRIPAFLETPGFVNPINSGMFSENGNRNMWSTRRIVVIMISNIVLLKSFSTRITAWMALYRRNGHSGTRTPDFPVMSRAFWPTELNVLSRGVRCNSRVEASSTVAIHALTVATKGLIWNETVALQYSQSPSGAFEAPLVIPVGIDGTFGGTIPRQWYS